MNPDSVEINSQGAGPSGYINLSTQASNIGGKGLIETLFPSLLNPCRVYPFPFLSFVL